MDNYKEDTGRIISFLNFTGAESSNYAYNKINDYISRTGIEKDLRIIIPRFYLYTIPVEFGNVKEFTVTSIHKKNRKNKKEEKEILSENKSLKRVIRL